MLFRPMDRAHTRPSDAGPPGILHRPGLTVRASMSRAAFDSKDSHLARPRGLLGWIAGQVMVATNRPMNELTSALLDVQPIDHVLEVGFGPGTLIRLLAEKATQGYVAGVDPSDVMVKVARKRNRSFIERGLVDLCQGTVSRLPYRNHEFTKACAVNSLQFWPALQDNLREVRRVMKDGGLLVLALRMRDPTGRFMGPIESLVTRAGFRDVRTEVHSLRRGTATFLLGQC